MTPKSARNLGQTEARFRLAELNLQRSEKLGESQSNSIAEVDRLPFGVRFGEVGSRSHEVRVERTEIRAPFDGIVGGRKISPGDYVSSQSQITTIDDLSRLKIDFQVPERFAAKVRQGTIFKVKSQALARSEPSCPARSISWHRSSIARPAPVKLKVSSAPSAPGLKPGMFANVELVLGFIKAFSRCRKARF